MKVPNAAPVGIWIEAESDGARLSITDTSSPVWAFWKTRSHYLDRHGLIWLYQTCAKLLRHAVVEPGYNELADDLTRAVIEVDKPAQITRGDKWYEGVAVLLQQKGWVKM